MSKLTWLKKSSISTKIILLMVSISTITLFGSAISFTIADYIKIRNSIIDKNMLVTQVVDKSINAPILFNDEREITEILDTLSAKFCSISSGAPLKDVGPQLALVNTNDGALGFCKRWIAPAQWGSRSVATGAREPLLGQPSAATPNNCPRVVAKPNLTALTAQVSGWRNQARMHERRRGSGLRRRYCTSSRSDGMAQGRGVLLGRFKAFPAKRGRKHAEHPLIESARARHGEIRSHLPEKELHCRARRSWTSNYALRAAFKIGREQLLMAKSASRSQVGVAGVPSAGGPPNLLPSS